MLHASARVALLASILALACGPKVGSSSDASSSGGETTASGETSSASATTSPTTSVESSTSVTAADESTTTDPGGPVEYVGTWTTGFGAAYFTACGEAEQWIAIGEVPGYELCDGPPLWLRVTGLLMPPAAGGSTPVLDVLEIHEGPCTEGSCDGSAPIGGECGTFEELCNTGAITFECDPFVQDCPDGEKCMPWAYDGGMEWNGTRCVPVADRGTAGDPCLVEGSAWSGIDDCAPGSMCWDVDPATNEGTCVALCDTSLEPDPACPVGTCTPFFAAEAPWMLGVCVDA